MCIFEPCGEICIAVFLAEEFFGHVASLSLWILSLADGKVGIAFRLLELMRSRTISVCVCGSAAQFRVGVLR